MLIPIDQDSQQPRYQQIYHYLKNQIMTGHLLAGHKLPSKRQLALDNGISQNTVVRAYDQLLVEGYIQSKERSGYYVCDISYQTLTPPTQPNQARSTEQSSNDYQLDLSKSIPDQDIFPYTKYRQIYRHILAGEDSLILDQFSHQGLVDLRQQIQNYLQVSRSVPCQADQVVIGASFNQLFTDLIRLFDQPLDLALEDPGYLKASHLNHLSQVKTWPIPLASDGLDLDALAASPADWVCVTPGHQYPTGSIMPMKKRLQLLDWLQIGGNRYIIEDDYDSEFKYGGLTIPSLKHLDHQDRVIYFGSFTRTLAPGLRVAYMVLPRHLVVRYQDKFSHLSSTVSSLTQLALSEFMRQGEFANHLNRTRRYYGRKRDQIIKALSKYDPAGQVYGEEAGLHILFKPSQSFDLVQFKKMAGSAGLKIRSLADFSSICQAGWENILFISFSAVPTAMLDNLAHDLIKWVKESAVVKKS
ncbi:hypothetical protein AWM75_05570 [Aerococcus urinaehominis]|uniref:Uncharacterized protein n=1 Tax=Aerococcus urinaehominis TaxID=128944 RepID=A0A0X8FLG8_9LACT|nr:PLP-dependent aminotransferase family protein [Aerococcus urinaehominis]AMB99495.1 hypothetical protein AWM75_05570 [Aerococcus urinaehominis]SDM26451.1 GntR family transcriptional regulator / MocR family aminotransferase [Aerococcus urinaehominis]